MKARRKAPTASNFRDALVFAKKENLMMIFDAQSSGQASSLVEVDV